jgi:hypothetical protein
MLVAAVMALTACGGDYREPLIGTWNGTDTVTLSSAYSATDTIQPFAVTVHISASGNQDLLIDGFECPLTALAHTGQDFSIDPSSCSFTDAATGCAYTFSYSGGTGTLSGRVLQVGASGSYSASCPGGLVDSGTFTEAASLG